MATAAKTSLEKRIRAVSNFITFVPFHKMCLMLGNFSGVDSKGVYLSFEKEKEKDICCLAFTSSIKRETGMFHVVVVQCRQIKCTKKRDAVQSYRFGDLRAFLLGGEGPQVGEATGGGSPPPIM